MTILQPDTNFSMSHQYFQQKLISLLTAIKHINNSELSVFIIFSDSKNVLSAFLNMKELKHQSYFIQELNKFLFEEKKDKNIELVWVPAHNGIKSNDKADELAKKVAVEGPLLELNY